MPLTTQTPTAVTSYNPAGAAAMQNTQQAPVGQSATGTAVPTAAIPTSPAIDKGDPSNPPTQKPGAPQQFNPQSSPFAGLLMQMFNQHQTPSSSPQWTPGMNPFAGSFQPQNFGGSYSAVQAPGTQLTGNIASPNNPLAQQTTSSLASWLQNPSSFGAPQVQQSYNYLSGNIDDQYKQQQQLLQEEMAKRGLADSSIYGGRMSDLNVANKSAHEQLANQLLYQQALTGGQDRANAINAAMGYGNNLFSQGMQQQGLQANVNNQNFQQMLAQAAFQGDQNAASILQNLNIAGFNNTAGQQGFDNALASWQANQNAGQQGFQNQLASYGMGLSGQQQGFNQQQQLLANLLGYNQQDFQNQLATYNANQGANQWYQTLLAQLAMNGAG